MRPHAKRDLSQQIGSTAVSISTTIITLYDGHIGRNMWWDLRTFEKETAFKRMF
jgi:hypothetical protein